MQCGSWASCFRQALCGLHGSSGVDPLRSLWREVRSFRRSNSQNVDSTCNNEIKLFPDTEIAEDTWRDRSVWVQKQLPFALQGTPKSQCCDERSETLSEVPSRRGLVTCPTCLTCLTQTISDHIQLHQKTWFANHMFNHSIYILSSKSRSHFKMFLNPILSVNFLQHTISRLPDGEMGGTKVWELSLGSKVGSLSVICLRADSIQFSWFSAYLVYMVCMCVLLQI